MVRPARTRFRLFTDGSVPEAPTFSRTVSNRLAYLPLLDPLRALAVSLVILFHFLPRFELGELRLGWFGVDLFFLLSGFLITAILLEQKASDKDRGRIIRYFIIRRALRLFPAYYLFLITFYLLQRFGGLWSWDAGDGVWFFTYTSNILSFLKGAGSWQLSHLWSLAVEEQFYLVWPWLAIFLPTSRLRTLLLIAIPLGFAFKCIRLSPEMRMLTPAHFDTLGLGALIAIGKREQAFWLEWMKNKWVSLSLFSGGLLSWTINSTIHSHIVLHESGSLLIAVPLLVQAIFAGRGGSSDILARQSWLMHIGRISYGLYLYHMPIPILLIIARERWHWDIGPWSMFLLALVLTWFIAEVSFRSVETPFLKLKERFDT